MNQYSLSILALAFALAMCDRVAFASETIGNIAPLAKVSASSSYSLEYAAEYAVDGVIPSAGCLNDAGKAWCVDGSKHRHQAEFTFEWTNAVRVAELVYFGRTAFLAEECWKDYELSSNDDDQPVASGQFQMGHGPQRITLPSPVRTRFLKLRFKNSYKGANPGASEIQVYSTPAAELALGKFIPLPPGPPELPDETPFESSTELEAQLAEGNLGFDKLLLIQRRELNPSHVYTYHVEGFSPGGGLFILDVKKKGKAALRQLVASPEGQILDCDLSHDAREILFSWRRAQKEGYQVFVVNSDGTNLRQLTDGPHHNYNACWLPDGGIAFLSTRSSRFAYCWISPVGILHRMERDGLNVTQLSANIVNDFTPSVLEDGRIIYSRWEYVDKPAIPIQSLWTIRPDGTGLAGFFGNRVLSPATFMEARSIPGTGKVLCVLTSHNGPCRGAIGMVDISHGNNAVAGIQNLTPEIEIGEVDKGNGNDVKGPYESPFPVDDKYFLVSKRGRIIVRCYDNTQAASVIAPTSRLGYYSAQPFKRRVPSPVLAAQPNISAMETNSEVRWATVVLQDVYQGLEPHVKRGEIKEICVVEEMRKAVRTDVANRAFGFQFPVISCGATYAAKTVWGFAPVAEDGSACFQVPASKPIYFMALDAQGRAIQRMRTFTHLMPGEQQGCVGCHEPRRQSPALANQQRSAPMPLRVPEWGNGVGFDYSGHVQPVLDQHCTSCHSGPTPSGKVDLSGDKTDFFNVSYEALARGRVRIGEGEWNSPYVSWIPTYNGMEANILEITPKAWGSPRSKLADLLLSGHPDKKAQPRIKLASHEVRRLLTWMDLNVPYYGTSETAHPEKRGCRQIYPESLDATLADVAKRRCAECHPGGTVPREVWTRITNPQLNNFLSAPLDKKAGGSGVCGQTVFRGTQDPDYQLLLRQFESCLTELKNRPRMDMPGAKPAAVDRNCLGSL